MLSLARAPPDDQASVLQLQPPLLSLGVWVLLSGPALLPFSRGPTRTLTETL